MHQVMVKLEQIRRKMKLSQGAFAAVIGVNESSYRRWRSGSRLINRNAVRLFEEKLQLGHNNLVCLISDFQKTCACCNGVFWPLTIRQRFCSRACIDKNTQRIRTDNGHRILDQRRYRSTAKGRESRKRESIQYTLSGRNKNDSRRFRARKRTLEIFTLAVETERLAKLEQERAELQALKARRAREDYERRLTQVGE